MAELQARVAAQTVSRDDVVRMNTERCASRQQCETQTVQLPACVACKAEHNSLQLHAAGLLHMHTVFIVQM